MSSTKGKDKAIDEDIIERTAFNSDIRHCRLCATSKENERLIEVCECMGEWQFVHFSCLKAEVRKTQTDICRICGTRYIGVKIKRIAGGFATFICSTENFTQLVFGVLLLSFLYYILYLAAIDYIISDGLINQVLRIILIVPTVFYGLVFSIVAFVFILRICAKYQKWKIRNCRFVLTQINLKSSENQIRKQDFNSSQTQTQSRTIKGDVHQSNREKRHNYVKIVTKGGDLSSEQNKSNDLNMDCVAISMGSLSGQSIQTPKDTQKNSKGLKFDNKTETRLALTQTKNADEL